MVGRSPSKTSGTVWEYKFFSQVLDRGYDLFLPACEDTPVDCHVCNSAGTIYRVQIKGTGELSKEGRPSKTSFGRYKITASTGNGNKTPIDCTKVDLLAAYIAPVNAWYLVPCLKLRGVSTWFYPHIENSKGQYEKFRDNWEIFDG